jgi:TusE/DsrC/DsvC family sulfur relay protein
MPVTTVAGHEVHVDQEGFLTAYEEWTLEVADALARAIGLELTADHLAVIGFLREDFRHQGETATLRRVSTVGGFAMKQLFELFPHKPAKKMAYVAGLPKPRGCV